MQHPVNIGFDMILNELFIRITVIRQMTNRLALPPSNRP